MSIMNTMDDNTLLNKLAAFNAAYQFLRSYFYDKEYTELRTLLSGMLIGPSGLVQDANTMYTWAESLANEHGVAVDEYHKSDQPEYPKATTKDWYLALKSYVKYFKGSRKSAQFDSILNDLERTNFSDQELLQQDQAWLAWLECCSETVSKE